MKVVQFTVPKTSGNSLIVQEDKLPFFYNYLHRHKEIQIALIIKGEGTLVVGNYMQRFQAGDIYITGANQPHIFRSDSSYFSNSPAKQDKKNVHSLSLFFSPQESFGSILFLPEMKEIKHFLDKTVWGLQAPPHERHNLAKQMLHLKQTRNGLLLSEFIRLLHNMAHTRKWKILSTTSPDFSISEFEGLRMNDIYQYTMANYPENISLRQIAAVAHLTVPAFCRYFKKQTNKTYVNFLNEIRISEACNSISEGEFKSMSSVAHETGFSNVTNFNRVFKKINGIPPRQFLEKYKR
ncbi:MAG: AraC family transcriptional regulator [Bacteroidota bacterium]|nr:AraC family transcriptional regulator [Bacteroidota bacterium]